MHLVAKMKALLGYVFLVITAVARGVEQIRPFSSSGDSSAGFTFSGGSSSSGSIGDSSASSASGDLHLDVVPAGEGSGNYSGGSIIVQPTDIATTSEPTAAPTSKSSLSTFCMGSVCTAATPLPSRRTIYKNYSRATYVLAIHATLTVNLIHPKEPTSCLLAVY